MQAISEGAPTPPVRPIGGELRTDASTWPLLARLSGRSAHFCRSVMHRLLGQDVTRQIRPMSDPVRSGDFGKHGFSSPSAGGMWVGLGWDPHRWLGGMGHEHDLGKHRTQKTFPC